MSFNHATFISLTKDRTHSSYIYIRTSIESWFAFASRFLHGCLIAQTHFYIFHRDNLIPVFFSQGKNEEICGVKCCCFPLY